MPHYKRIRSTKWFTNIGTGIAGDFVEATYRGNDGMGNDDPFGEGIIGKVYTVVLLTKKSAILAPCPEFCEHGEQTSLTEDDWEIVRSYRKLKNRLGKLNLKSPSED